MNITLIGMPASGKSSVGKVLAKRLGWAFLDVDPLIVARYNAPSLQHVLNTLGNDAFLDAEAEVIAGLDCHHTVIAPGGSAVLREQGMRRLKELGPVVWLDRPIQELEARLRNLDTRGVSLEPGQSIADLYRYRRPFYRQWADLRVDVTGCSVPKAASRVFAAVSPQISKKDVSMTFQDLGLCPPILSALRTLGYEQPSPIQQKAIPPALAGRDVLGCAQTGTGKTCAFATPILQRLNAAPVKGPRPIRALILTPTRELALQIQESFEAYGKNLPLRSAVIFGGVGQQPQVDRLKAGVDILVATPGRLEDLHGQGYIHVESLEIFVLDEADRMLDMGFIHDVRKILTWLPKKKQTLFFSATMPPEVQGLVDSLLTDPVKVAVDPVSSPVEIIDQRLFYVDRANKSKLLAQLVKHPDVKNALVFTRTKHGANKVAGDLQKAGVHAAAIHGNKSQTARQQALSDFKAGRVKALVATDIAARGLDIEELSHVFNYNLPDVPETYVHRIGRTGRAGRGGTAVSFCEFGEKELLVPIEKLLKKPIPVVEGHPWPMQVFEAPKRDKHGKIINADDDEARQAARERKRDREAAKKAAAPTVAAPVSPAPTGAGPRPARTPSRSPAPTPVRPSKPAQTPAAGKRASAGYKPSHTLDEALTSMAPKQAAPTPAPAASADSREAAFRRWMEEEQAIQAGREYHRDPLDGDVIMDATARLLAPKGSVPPKAPARELSAAPPKQKQEQKRPGQAPQRKQEQKRRGKAAPTETAPTGAGPRPARSSARSGQKAPAAPKAPAPQQPQTSATLEARRKAARERARRGGHDVKLNLGSQKDSTEQSGSLMRPYYFNPHED